MAAAPVRYTPDVETLAPDENETINQINQTFDTILERTAEDYGHAVRSVHAKAHGILKGELEVDANLPPELAQGLFAQAGTHPVFIRISTNAGDILDDEISLPRGFALKVLDVEGERLPAAEGTTQDFVMVNGPVFQAKETKQFLSNLKQLAKTTDKLEGTKKAMSGALQGVRKVIEAVGLEAPPKVAALGGAPQAEPLGATYYSQTPFRYGDYIAKFSVVPVTPEMKKLAEQEIEVRGREDAIREEIHNEMRVMDAEWELRVQLCRDLDKQPVEDATVKWDEEEAPFARVGVIRAPSQDSWSPELVQAVDEEMRFSVWTGLAAHRPLGQINRARNAPYRHSADFRAKFNACPYREPASAQA